MVTHPAAQGVCDSAQHLVADEMTVRVVDVLEVVDVDEQHRNGLAVAAPRLQGARCLALPGDRGQQAGLGIVPGGRAQLGVQQPALQQQDRWHGHDEQNGVDADHHRHDHTHAHLQPVQAQVLGIPEQRLPGGLRVHRLDRDRDQQ